MKDNKLTTASIHNRRIGDINIINLNIPIFDRFAEKEYPHILIIQSTIENRTKLIIYPIKKEKLIKVSLFGQNITDGIIGILSRILKNYEIIHTSGLLIKKKKLFYECYLNLNLSDIKSKELKASLDKIKIKKIFMEVKIEEISIEKSKKYIK